MSVITMVSLLNRSPLQAIFRQRLSLNQWQLCGRTLQSLVTQNKLLYCSTSRFFSLNKLQLSQPATAVTSKVNKVQQVAAVSSKLTGNDQRRGIAADTQTTAVAIWEDLKQIRFSPVPALVLGFSGLIPFIAAPAYMIFSQAFCSQVLFAQTAYGACILSFLGGVRWGFVIPEESEGRGDWLNFGYSVTPSLVAWTALLLPQPFSILVVLGGIAGSAYFDTAAKGYPPWFKGLRFTLSFFAVLSLWTTFLCQYLLGAPSDKERGVPAKEKEL